MKESKAFVKMTLEEGSLLEAVMMIKAHMKAIHEIADSFRLFGYVDESAKRESAVLLGTDKADQ